VRACLLAAAAGVVWCPAAALADPLVLAAGKPVDMSCDTQSVVVAPDAATSKGTFRIRLEAKDSASGLWSLIDMAQAHTSSFVARQKDTCAQGCLLAITAEKPFELWAPKRAAPGSLLATEPLTVATLDPVTLKLRASTFLDKDVAALEQGECKVVP
jgi:hypothetical protein